MTNQDKLELIREYRAEPFGCDGLTDQEAEAVEMALEGKSLKQIAGQIGLTLEGARKRFVRVEKKTGIGRDQLASEVLARVMEIVEA
jgi:DNA-binding CsgD family transcriptional regulator